jgi:hypothetical protein
MQIKGILWHSTGANNKTLRRYVQPSDVKPTEDTYDKAKWLEILGKNKYSNDWNHVKRQTGLNAWIGELADGTISAVQSMPWDFRPWGCGGGSKGSCNDGWIQFEICEDGLKDSVYFNKVYEEACELTAYLCKKFNIDPQGTVVHKGVTVPTILCHKDSYKLGLGSNHGDIDHWFPKHGKSMATARADVAALLKTANTATSASTTTATAATTTTAQTYKVVTTINKYSNAASAKAQTNAKGTFAPGTYYIYKGYPNGYNGMYNLTTDKTGAKANSWINPKENVIQESVSTNTTVEKPVEVITLSKIEIANKPDKIDYTVGESYDGTGLIIKAIYSDNSTKVITDYKVSGFDSTKAGSITINATFENKTATFVINVKEKEVIPEPEAIAPENKEPEIVEPETIEPENKEPVIDESDSELDQVESFIPEAITPDVNEDKTADIAALIFNIFKKLITMLVNLFNNKGE